MKQPKGRKCSDHVYRNPLLIIWKDLSKKVMAFKLSIATTVYSYSCSMSMFGICCCKFLQNSPIYMNLVLLVRLPLCNLLIRCFLNQLINECNVNYYIICDVIQWNTYYTEVKFDCKEIDWDSWLQCFYFILSTHHSLNTLVHQGIWEKIKQVCVCIPHQK